MISMRLAISLVVSACLPAAAQMLWLTVALGAVIINIGTTAQRVAAQVASPQPPDRLQAKPTAGTPGRLDLVDGGSVLGQLLPSAQEATIRWQAAGFTRPFDFAAEKVRQITMEIPADLQPPENEFACVLDHGGCIYGQLVGLSAEAVVLQTAEGQRLRIDRQRVQRLLRAVPQIRNGRRTSIDDPGRRTPWEFDSSGNRWKLAAPAPRQEPAAVPAADPFGGGPANAGDDPFGGAQDNRWAIRQQAELRAKRLLLERFALQASTSSGYFVDLELAPKCLLEFDIAWDETPQFNLALGVDHSHQALKQAIRLTVWHGQLVLTRELDSRLHLVPVLSIQERAAKRSLQLMIYFDQPAGRVVIRERSGKLLAELPTSTDKPQMGPGVRLVTSEGTRATRLTASTFSWDSLAAAATVGGAPQIVLNSGKTIQASIKRLDTAGRILSFQQQNASHEISLDQIQQLILAVPAEPEDVAAVAENRRTQQLHQLFTNDGGYFQGQWLGVEEDHLRMRVAGIEEPVRVPLTRLESISSTRRADEAAVKPSRTGRLITSTATLLGRIAQSDPEAATPQLLWHPEGSLNAAPLHAALDGEIVYQTARPPVEAFAASHNARPRQAAGGMLLQAFDAPAKPLPAHRVIDAGGRIRIVRASPPPPSPTLESLFLCSGDTIACQITHIDSHGISFRSPSVPKGFARHDQVKSLILAGLIQPRQISEATRQRLLTVPRIQRDDPPSHLICARNGDFLRGRLLGMDDESLRIEVRLDTLIIPRDRVAQIFWMHPEVFDAESSEKIVAPETLRVQALRRDGTRMTFDFHACRDESILVGHHEILGACEVELLQLDRLLLGKAIERWIEDSPLASWRLHDAPNPKAFLRAAGDSEGGVSGTESLLVGKPAPEFELQLLSGGSFRLADHRGRVVVLDFWASWCGPCIQAMPQIEAVVGEFPKSDVQLVAVNLQEQPAAITAALERMGLEVPVALDRNGSVADQYGVTAIPQTVIVGPDGKVARLYVGARSSLAPEMRSTIAELLRRTDPQATAEE